MNPSLLTAHPSSPHCSVLFSPFINPNPLRLTSNSITSLTRRRRYKISVVHSSTSGSDKLSTTDSVSVSVDVFGGKKELSGLQSLVDSLSPAVRLASPLVIVAGAVAAGHGLGFRVGGTRNVALGSAVAFGAAGGAAAYALNSCVPEVAAANLHSCVAGCDDPCAIKKEDIEGIAKKYGVSKQDEAFNSELCDLYCRFVSSVIPPGSENLIGNEVETIIKFKNALGIDDPDVAAMHMEIGRQIFRQRLETGDRDADIEQRRCRHFRS